MHEFSTVDGFVEINESLAEMIKNIANEPSVGLYYIQQHVRNAVPNVVNLNNNILEKSRDTVLHSEDLEDSITTVELMKESGSVIAEEMIRDIENSLAIMSTKQRRRGLILNTSPWSRSNSSLRISDFVHGSDSGSYFSSVFKSAKERASNIKWPQLNFKDQKLKRETENQSHRPTVPLHITSESSCSSYQLENEVHELPIPNDNGDEVSIDVKTSKEEHILETSDYDEFKAGKEANLKSWLGGMDGNVNVGGHTAERI